MKNSITMAIIPARSGSKGLQDKNILPLAGKPLIAYSIEAARESGMFDRIFVSTDSEHYAQIARQYGAEVPCLRPAEISGDQSTSWSAVDHALEFYALQGYNVESFMLLQPTSPLRNAQDIRAAFALKKQKNANAIVSVCKPDHSPLWSLSLPEDMDLSAYHERFNDMVARQHLHDRFYRLNGAIYLADTLYYKHANDIYQTGCYGYEMPAERSFDVDSMVDFLICETLLKYTDKIAEKNTQ